MWTVQMRCSTVDAVSLTPSLELQHETPPETQFSRVRESALEIDAPRGKRREARGDRGSWLYWWSIPRCICGRTRSYQAHSSFEYPGTETSRQHRESAQNDAYPKSESAVHRSKCLWRIMMVCIHARSSRLTVIHSFHSVQSYRVRKLHRW